MMKTWIAATGMELGQFLWGLGWGRNYGDGVGAGKNPQEQGEDEKNSWDVVQIGTISLTMLLSIYCSPSC